MFYYHRHIFLWGIFTNITIILHENREHVPAASTKYSHLAATPGAAYPPRLGLAYLGQYLGHISSKVYGEWVCDSYSSHHHDFVWPINLMHAYPTKWYTDNTYLTHIY